MADAAGNQASCQVPADQYCSRSSRGILGCCRRRGTLLFGHRFRYTQEDSHSVLHIHACIMTPQPVRLEEGTGQGSCLILGGSMCGGSLSLWKCLSAGRVDEGCTRPRAYCLSDCVELRIISEALHRFAGILTAAALAPSFKRVIVLERDDVKVDLDPHQHADILYSRLLQVNCLP